MILLLLACPGDEPVAAPSLEWISPTDGEAVAAGDVACSIIVNDFTLEDPTKHNEGAPLGYIGVSLDGAEAGRFGTTTFTLTLTAGAHELAAQLHYGDGDEVLVAGGEVCAEDPSGCEPVVATIGVTAD